MWLDRKGDLRVGSDLDVDFRCVGDDLDQLHFSIRAFGDFCTLIGESHRGTFVNGQLVSQIDLQDGDIVSAGRLEARVCIETAEVRPAARNFRLDGSHVPMSGGDAFGTDAAPEVQLPFGFRRCDSGVTVYEPIADGDTGHGTGFDFETLMSCVATDIQLHLIVHVQSLSWQDRQRYSAIRELPELMPFVAFVEGTSDFGREHGRDLLTRTTGADAVTGLLSRSDGPSLFRSLKPVATSFSHPSIWEAQVARAPDGFRQQLFGEVEGVLLMRDESTFSLFCDNDEDEAWKQLGLASAPANLVRDSPAEAAD